VEKWMIPTNPDKQKKPHSQEGELWGKGFWVILLGGRSMSLGIYITKMVRYVKKLNAPSFLMCPFLFG